MPGLNIFGSLPKELVFLIGKWYPRDFLLVSIGLNKFCLEILLSDPRINPRRSLGNKFDMKYGLHIFTALEWACFYGYFNVVKKLLNDPRVDPRRWGQAAIGLASENGHTKICKLLLADPRVDPSFNGNYALKYAAENGHSEVVRVLLTDPRVNPHDGFNFAIRKAAEKNHDEVLSVLVQDKRVVNNLIANKNEWESVWGLITKICSNQYIDEKIKKLINPNYGTLRNCIYL